MEKTTTLMKNRYTLAEHYAGIEDTFVPAMGVTIIYPAEDGVQKMKLGDGQTTLANLPWVGGVGSSGGEGGTSVLDSLLSLSGANKKTLNMNNCSVDAVADYAIVGGTNDKTVISNILGSLASTNVKVDKPIINADCGISFGSGTIVNSTGGNAIGVWNTSGIKGYYWDEINFANKTITITSTRRVSTLVNPASQTVEGNWKIGDTISLVNDSKYPAFAKITAVNGNTITVDNLPFTKINYESKLSVFTYGSPDDRTIFACYEKSEVSGVNSRWYPRSGAVELGWAGTAFGVENLVTGSGSFAAGWNNWSAGDFGVTFGRDNISGYASIVGGTQNTAPANNVIVGGSTNTVKGGASLVAGQNSIIESGNVLAGGANHSITNSSSCTTVGGDGNILTNAWCSAVFGNKNIVDGQFNLLGGKNNKSSSHCNVIGGEGNTITGNDSAIFGQENTSKASQTFIAGMSNKIATNCGETAVFGNSNAVGSDEAVTKPDGSSATIIGVTNILVGGKNNKAYASCTTIGGQANIAWAGNAAMFGYNNVAKSYSAFLAGDGNISTRGCQAVFGQYNDPTSTLGDLFVVGNGANSSSAKEGYTAETTNTGGTHYVKRSNAFRITSTGNAIISGKATVGANPTADMDVATKKYVDENAGSKVDFSNVEIGVLSVGRRADDGLDTDSTKESDRYANAKNTVASWSLGVGRKLTISNSQSFSAGYNNINASSCTFTAGEGLKVNTWCMSVLGRYNKTTNNALLVVGNGSSTSPSDAFIVQSDGRATVGKAPTAAMDVATKQYVDSHSGGVSIDDFDSNQFTESNGIISLNLNYLLEQEW